MGTRQVVMLPPVWGLLGCCFLCGWARGGLPPLSSQARPGSAPWFQPPEGAEAALAFLYSRDAQQLSGANCSERYEAPGAEASPGLPPILGRAAGTLAQAANFLNLLLQANDIRESSVEEDVEWYQALVRSVAEGDPGAYRAVLAFHPPPGASHPQLALQATRVGEETVLQDLSGSRGREDSVIEALASPALQKRVLTNDLGSLGSPKWPRGDGYLGDTQHVRLSAPFLECQEGRLRPGWLLTLSATFYGLKPDLSPEIRGQVQMDIDLQTVDINQCASGPGWYSNTHLCDLNSTQCIPLESQGFVLGRYLCRCQPGFYGASLSPGLEENATQPAGQFGSPQGRSGRLLQCQPCAEGCASCVDATPCLVEEARALRAAVLACQACCMLAVFLSMLLSYRWRQSKRIRASGVVLLETILFGSLLLYFPVFILYFKPSVFRCIALRWVRLLGFATVYGTITLKLHRVLQLFLSRTAQRGPHLRSGQQLRRLGVLLLLVLGFLAVWTARVLERGALHTPLVTRGHTPAGRRFSLCHHDRWDYSMAVAEMLLLCWGSFLCHATRAVPSAFHEPRYMGIALHNELLLSAAFHAARFALAPSLHPDWTLLLSFLHTHSTVTATLALLFIPKFWKPGAPPREEMVDEEDEDELDLQCSGSYFNSSTVSAWSERSLDPGDIREELKKLYAQLEVHKTKEMAANNPHLPKKRGGSRQGLGHSLMRYLAEFPEALGSPGRGSLPGSSRRRLLSASLQEPEGPRALRQARSIYGHGHGHGHGREQDPPLLDSLLRRKLAKRASREAESREMAEGPPALGFRSASAHNLTVGERLPRARPASLQKSLSVMAGSGETALLVASQAYLEESYRQAKEREQRKKAEAALASPVRRPSARRLEAAGGAPRSAPPSPARSSSSVDGSSAPRKLQEEAARRLAHSPVRHQVSTPAAALAAEPRMLSPTATLAPALLPAPAPVLAPAPALAAAPMLTRSPSFLTFICPWESAELPAQRDIAAPEGPSGPERGNRSPGPARARLWRALSVAVEKRGAGEPGRDAEDRPVQGEAEEADEDRPKIFSKSHSLKSPAPQGSVRSLGLAIKALTRSRSSHREKGGGEGSPERDRGRASGDGVGACPRSPRLGGRKVVSKQAALAPCEDQESLQNQQNAHTSRLLHSCHQEGGGEQEDGGRRPAVGPGEGTVERAGRTGPATRRQVGDRRAEPAQEAPVGRQERLGGGLPHPHPHPGSAGCGAAEVGPWEVPESQTSLPESNRADICPWEVSGGPEKGAFRRDLGDSQGERGKVLEEPEPADVAALARKKPERLVRGQEAVCPWENAEPRDPSPQDSERTQEGRSEAAGGTEAEEAEKGPQMVTGPEACAPDMAQAELCPREASGGGGRGGESEKPCQEGARKLPQEKQPSPKKATSGEAEKPGRDLESLSAWERTDFRGPVAISAEAPGTPECPRSAAEGCPREAAEASATRRAEICPWELGDEDVGEEMLHQGTGGESGQEEDQASRKGLFGDTGGQSGKAAQTSGPQQESLCPGESTAPGHPSPGLDNSPSRACGPLLGDGGSRATQGGPRGDLEPEGKAEICPWEASEATEAWTSKQPPKGGDSLQDREQMPETLGVQDVTAWEKPEGQRQKREAVCPWEGMDPGILHPPPGPPDTERPKAGFQVSSGVGSKAAEICPWDVEDTLSAERAEVCPWEGSAGAGGEQALGGEALGKLLNVPGEGSADPGPPEAAAPAPKEPARPAGAWGVTCPWASGDPGRSSPHSDPVNTDPSTAGFQELGHVGGKAAEVCPWEVEEAPTSERAEICPWEVNGGATGKGLEQDMGSDAAEQREETPERRRLASLQEDKSKRETKPSPEQQALCPGGDWRGPSAQAPQVSDSSGSVSRRVTEEHSLGVEEEAAEKEDPIQDPQTDSLRGHVTREKAPPSKAEDGKKANEELESICLWESTAPAIFSSGPQSECPGPPKAGSQRLVSLGGRHAEVCPWDAPASTDSSIKAEVCPWEVTERIPGGVSTQSGKGEPPEEEGKAPEKPEPQVGAVEKKPERADRKQEAVCPWESQDGGGLSPPPAPHAFDNSKGAAEAAGREEARVAEVCPWEAVEVLSAKRAEICPWERSTAAAEGEGPEPGADRALPGPGEALLQKAGSGGGTKEHVSKAATEGSREQATVRPWAGMDSGGLSPQPDALDTDPATVSPQGASRVGSRMAELYQWEVTDPEGNKIKGTMADICPWEETGAPSEESDLPALSATQPETFSPRGLENPAGLSIQRPLGSSLPASKCSRPQMSQPASSCAREGVTEFQGPSRLGPRTSLASGPTLQEAEAQNPSSLTEHQGGVASEDPHEELAPPTVYPWDWE